MTNELKNGDRKSQNDSKIYYSGDAILGEANQSKNLKIDGANDTNDRPVFVEVEAKSNRRVVENEAILGKENQYKTLEVVIIPNGSFSPNISSNNIQEDHHLNTCPGIYKKGACPSPSELPSVIMNSENILGKDNQSKNLEVVNIPVGSCSDFSKKNFRY